MGILGPTDPHGYWEMMHQPVLLNEVVECINMRSEGVYLDCTVGGGGHTAALASALTTGRVIGLDCDARALARASERLRHYGDRVTLVQTNFAELTSVLDQLEIAAIDGVIFDLGVSSFQLNEADRGFSFRQSAPLDMRMDQRLAQTAADVVYQAAPAQLERIIREYGEERWARQIVRAIVRAREQQAISSTTHLAHLIERSVPRTARSGTKIHPATRTFQALRIHVNNELGSLQRALPQAWNRLKIGGRLIAISFHSLEDRIVKHFMQSKASSCVCPPELPICVCHKIKELRALKPILPNKREINVNPRSRSAKMRVGIKLA
jgi:16S rRNA (cytosine1402-N4)-methyltransferase